MARYRGAPNRPADVLAALPAELQVFRRSRWAQPGDEDDPSGAEWAARHRWQLARSAYVEQWGVSKIELLLLERDDRFNRMREESAPMTTETPTPARLLEAATQPQEDT